VFRPNYDACAVSEPLLNVMKIMLLAGLYLFFVRVLWSVFSELRDPRTVTRKRRDLDPVVAASARTTARRSASPPSAPTRVGQAAALAVVTPTALGQLRMSDTGMMFPLGAEVTVGRANTNGIVVNDTYMSTVHARIFNTNGTYFIEDLASRNGSTLNGLAIVATTALVSGDVLQFGGTTMEFS
jgi:hypothetical protein